MMIKNYVVAASLGLVAMASSQAVTVFSDTFDYTTNGAFVTEGGWTSHTGNGGSDAGSGIMWGNGNVLEYQHGDAVAAGDVISMWATLQRDWGGYFYSMDITLWDGVNDGSRVQAAFVNLEGNSATGKVLDPLSYTVTGADIAAGRDHVVIQYSHSQNWGETQDVTLDVTAVPEPSSAALLGLGGLALILRRRK
ncbi:PEP-CTERM sorting domain-containing protein [Sulfuriroseicoccus oceanibius]|uniref:PEP-CTERM sorting domain-containing protein n=1 Tax=Sulfuriroseicoccus oceanibius TaxID=2707525 RepID=UPI001F4272C7|nr:PEP-CTERM sorting domain-containing protein [Sulfuriroseicoccus oceanibius]